MHWFLHSCSKMSNISKLILTKFPTNILSKNARETTTVKDGTHKQLSPLIIFDPGLSSGPTLQLYKVLLILVYPFWKVFSWLEIWIDGRTVWLLYSRGNYVCRGYNYFFVWFLLLLLFLFTFFNNILRQYLFV